VDPEAARGKGNPEWENLEVFAPAIILDRNSQVCLHNAMIRRRLVEVTVARLRVLVAA
jgi:hypothetical protein